MKELEQQEKDLLKAQKVKKVQKLKKEVEEVEEEVVQKPQQISGFTKKDLEDAQLEAIMKYEALRKQRKKKKQEDAEEEKKKQETLNAIRKATQPRNNITRGQQGFWDDMY